MLMLVDTMPKFCPECGWAIRMPRGDCQREFYGSVTMCCTRPGCGCEYVYVERAALVAGAAAAGSDFTQVTRQGV